MLQLGNGTKVCSGFFVLFKVLVVQEFNCLDQTIIEMQWLYYDFILLQSCRMIIQQFVTLHCKGYAVLNNIVQMKQKFLFLTIAACHSGIINSLHLFGVSPICHHTTYFDATVPYLSDRAQLYQVFPSHSVCSRIILNESIANTIFKGYCLLLVGPSFSLQLKWRESPFRPEIFGSGGDVHRRDFNFTDFDDILDEAMEFVF